MPVAGSRQNSWKTYRFNWGFPKLLMPYLELTKLPSTYLELTLAAQLLQAQPAIN